MRTIVVLRGTSTAKALANNAERTEAELRKRAGGEYPIRFADSEEFAKVKCVLKPAVRKRKAVTA